MRGAGLALAAAVGTSASEYYASDFQPGGQFAPDLSGPRRTPGPADWHCGGTPGPNDPQYHLQDMTSCGINDPNGPVFDPVHGIYHVMYQNHQAAPPGHGPDYGHWASRDFVHWTQLHMSVWNGLDQTQSGTNQGFKNTPYDNEAIFTGSATVVPGFGPDGNGDGIIQIYPGLCNKNDWPGCKTGTLLAVAVPADYKNDPLLHNWTKPDYNPIIENTQRDPAEPWKTSYGEWRLRTFDGMVYGTASDADMKAGKWYTIGKNPSFPTAECPSFFPLPAATKGFEAEYDRQLKAGSLPNRVLKLSTGGKDAVKIGTYVEGKPKEFGNFSATPGWEELINNKVMDVGTGYACKDQKAADGRRINWAWLRVPPRSTQSIPHEVTFNPTMRQLEWAPIKEQEQLRGSPLVSQGSHSVSGDVSLNLPAGKGAVAEAEVVFELPSAAATFGVTVMGSATDSTQGTYFSVAFKPPSDANAAFYEVTVSAGTPPVAPTPAPPPSPVPEGCAKFEKDWDLPGGDYSVSPNNDTGCTADGNCPCQQQCEAEAKCQAWTLVPGQKCCLKGSVPTPKKAAGSGFFSGVKDPSKCHAGPSPSGGSGTDTLRLAPSEKTLSLRLFVDNTFTEAFWQNGRVTMSVKTPLTTDAAMWIATSAAVTANSVNVWPVNSIWVSEAEVLATPRTDR